jgi:hypothetical protein
MAGENGTSFECMRPPHPDDPDAHEWGATGGPVPAPVAGKFAWNADADYLFLQAINDNLDDDKLTGILNRNGSANLTVCPHCHVDDFTHVEGCDLSPLSRHSNEGEEREVPASALGAEWTAFGALPDRVPGGIYGCPGCSGNGTTGHQKGCPYWLRQLLPDIPRRNRVDLASPAESAIRNAVAQVEAMSADERLTNAVTLLGEAGERVADFIDGVNAPSVRLPPITVTLPHLADSLSQVTSEGQARAKAGESERESELHRQWMEWLETVPGSEQLDFYEWAFHKVVAEREAGVRDITARDLVLRALRNLPNRSADRRERWSAVSWAFGLGSTYSHELCRNFGLDPNEQIGRDRADEPDSNERETPSPISFGEGKKIYDQGWNDGIDHFTKLFPVVLAAQLRGRR